MVMAASVAAKTFSEIMRVFSAFVPRPVASIVMRVMITEEDSNASIDISVASFIQAIIGRLSDPAVFEAPLLVGPT